MIKTQILEVDAMIAELEACYLGMLEANVLKAGEIARQKVRITELEAKVKKAETPPLDETDGTASAPLEPR